jgi:hypothetical protein
MAVKKKKPEKITVDIDTPLEEVLKLNDDGKDLFFDSTPGKFKRLTAETLTKLRQANKTRYLVSRGLCETEREAVKPSQKFTVQPRFSTATNRLEVRNKDPNMHYCWKRTDELQQAEYEGFVPAYSDSELQSFGNIDGTGNNVVRGGGMDELVLMKEPKELHMKKLRMVEEKSAHMRGVIEEAAANKIRSQGGVPYTPPKNGSDGHPWTEPKVGGK